MTVATETRIAIHDGSHKRSGASVAELCNQGVLFVQDGNHGEYRPRPEEFCDQGVAFIRAGNMEDGHIDFGSASRINDIALSRIRKGIGKPLDILLSHKGTVGRIALAGHDSPPYVCSPQVTIWRTLDESVIDRYYLLYWMRSGHFRMQLESVKSRTDMADYASLTDQRSFTVPLPKIEEQRRIGAILGSLDDKIELNRRMNRTLEELARAVFKAWFVDFLPVRAKQDGAKSFPGMDADTFTLFPDSLEDSPLGPIPRGWRRQSLLGSACVLSGGTPSTQTKEYWSGDIQWASAKDVSQCDDPFLLKTERLITEHGLNESPTRMIPKHSTVIVARGATTGRMVILGDSMAMNQTCYALHSPEPFFLHLSMQHIVGELLQSSHGSVFNTITTDTLRRTTVIAPPRPIKMAFERTIGPSMELVGTNCRGSQTLAATRDLLLPKLLANGVRGVAEEASCG